MSEQQQLQVWVRNDKGQVYGPLSPPSVELLIDNGVIAGRLQVSTNGENYVFPGRVPGLRMIFPRETWGETVVPGDELDAQWSQVALPASLPGVPAPAAPAAPPPVIGAAPGGPVAGPGARGPVAGPGARGLSSPSGVRAPVAGNRPAHVARPVGAPASRPSSLTDIMTGAVPGAYAGSSPSSAGRPVRSSPSVMDFMNNATGAATPAAAAPVRSSPSVAEFMNSASPAAPVPRSPGSGVVAPPRPVVAPPPANPAPRPVVAPPPSAAGSSGSGVVRAPQNLQSLEELGMPASGAIGSPATAHLYYIAAARELTGLLTLKLADRELTVHFRKGNPEFLDSTHPEDSLDTFLVKERLATPQQIEQARAQAGRFGGELLPALFGLGLLNPNAVFQHLGQRATQLLFRALTAEQGTFSFDYEELAPSRAMPLGNKWSIYLDALRKVPGPDLRRRLMQALELPVMKAAGRIPVSDLRLTPQETRAYNHFDGARSLSQLVAAIPAEGDVMLRVAWMLVPLEVVSFAGLSAAAQARAAAAPQKPAPVAPAPAAPPQPAPPKPAPAAPAPPKPAPPPAGGPQRPPPPVMAPGGAPGNPVNMPRAGTAYPGGPQQPTPAAAAQAQRPPPPVMKQQAPAAPKVTAAPPADDLKQLQQLYETLKKANYFEVLGIKREADANQVKIAYLKAARSYHPDTIPPGAPEALAKVKADLFALIGEANRTLGDASLRADYIAELDAGGTGSKVDVEKLLKGEELFQKGRVYVQARKMVDAQKLFDEAIACNPDEPEFYAWRAYARFLAATDRKLVTADVTKEIKGALEKNPNCAAAYYFLGYVQKTNGDAKAALVNFKKCVQLDPKHIDAAREVKNAAGK